MKKTKAIIDFSGYAAADLAPVARAIYKGLSDNAAVFTSLPVTLVAFLAHIAAFEEKLADKASNSTADTIAFNIARHDLEGDLSELGGYVNSLAKGDPTIVSQSAFPSYDTAGRTPDTSPPAAPSNLVLRPGDLSGSFVARYRPDRDRSINEVQTCTADPNAQANWTHAGMFSGGKAVISGITPATTLWVRVRTVGLKGVMGEWSDPAKIIVV